MKKVIYILLLYFYYPLTAQNFTSDSSNIVFLDNQLYRINITTDQSSFDYLINSTSSDLLFDSSMEFITTNQVFQINNVGIRLRGNTSLTAPKKSFKLDFNSFVPGRKFLGLEKLNLNANHNDPSLFRAAISWYIFRQMEIPSTRTSFADLYINNNFMGVYVVTEHIDDEFIKKNYEKDHGNLYKCLWPAPLHYLGDDPESYKYESNGRRAYDLKTNKFDDDYSDLAHFISVLNSTSNDDFVCEIESVFNVADYLKILALDVLIGNWDGYAGNKNNYYLYHDPLTDLFNYIPYDLDNTWGVTWGNYYWENENPYNWASYMNFASEYRPLYDRFLAVQEYRNLFTHYLTEIIDNWFNEEFVVDYISSRKPLLSESIILDEYYPLSYGFTSSDYENSLTQAWGDHIKYGFIDWVNSRLESINLQLENQMPVLVLHEISDNSPVLDTLRIRAKVYATENVQVSAIVDTNYDFQTTSMFDDGLHGDLHENDGVWGVEIPISPEWISVDYRVQVITDNSPRISPCEPISASVGISPCDIKINELMPLNSSVVADEFFEFDDWCELYNNGSNSIDLNGFYLTDNISRPDKFKLSEEVIQGGEHTLYWLDNDPDQGENHAPFRLSSEGEELALFENEGNNWYLRDYISFGPIQENISFGRISDGASQWQLFEISTPNSSNNNSQTLEIDMGWSLISTYIQPDILDVSTVFSPLLDYIVILKNNTGSAYLPEWNFNGIGDMIAGQGYQIKLNSAQQLTILGEILQPELTPIDLTLGWNLIAYLRQSPSDVAAVFQEMQSNGSLVIVKDSGGNAYLPEWAFNGIGDMFSGKAYQIKTNEAYTLIYLSNNQDY